MLECQDCKTKHNKLISTTIGHHTKQICATCLLENIALLLKLQPIHIVRNYGGGVVITKLPTFPLTAD